MKPRVRILHLEDNLNDRELVQFALAKEGIAHEVVWATTKAEFTAALNQGGFDVILCDSSLPGFDGKAALALAQAKCPEVPFLFVSGHSPPARVDGLTPAGAKAVISKSDLKSLVDAMRAALTIKRSDWM
ncbi:MAG TPA: response regulator [Candidatus Binatia bacterium]|jgi:hypothetical protein|nr:response regulator [Candidatus Binatia bacterium]